MARAAPTVSPMLLSRPGSPRVVPHPPGALDLTGEVASTTAWGMADPLDVVLARIAAHTTASTVELAIGARPVADPVGVLDAYRDRFTFLAHHTVPVLPHAELRPLPELLATATRRLPALGITRYTVHPPNRRQLADEPAFFDWAWRWHDALAEAGLTFRLETMYQPRAVPERERTGGYHLDTALAVRRFADAAVARGWTTPLLIDASHLHIGVCGGAWTVADVDALLAAGLADHLHVSANDGVHDHHTLVPYGHPVDTWIAPHRHRFAIVVDEARRGTRRPARAGVRPSAPFGEPQP